MTDASKQDTQTCRHCSGLVAGQAAKCHYCKHWLRRVPDQVESSTSGKLVNASR